MKTLVSVDVETTCGVSGCEGKCEHALDANKNSITIIGCVWVDVACNVRRATFRSVEELGLHLSSIANAGGLELVGHNLKFDLKTLIKKGLDLSQYWEHDTYLMATTLLEKIGEEWLAWYEAERKRVNATLPVGVSHREGSPHSLKTLAPYFLGKKAFWENPACHDNEEYVLTDAAYTLELFHFLKKKLELEGGYKFYKEKLLPWTKLLLKAETKGIRLDLAEMEKVEASTAVKTAELRGKLDEEWKDAYKAYNQIKRMELCHKYVEMKNKAVIKAKDKAACTKRYEGMFLKAAEKLPKTMNLDSPAQLSWLLRDYLKLDITDFHGEESTGKTVLQKLATREDVKLFQEYRKASKLSSAFFPSYREMQHNSFLHTSFNPNGARTGRLSSSGPNLQQVPSGLHNLFVPREGYSFITKDQSAIEPRLIAYYTADLNLYTIVTSGQDFHGHTTRVLFEADWDVASIKEKFPLERKMGKEVGLSLFYGAGKGRLQETAQKYGFKWTIGECQRKMERFKEYYEGVYAFRDTALNPTLLAGYPAVSLFGRPYRIEDPTNVHLQGFNTLIQGSASDLVLESARRAQAEYDAKCLDAHILLLVHDEIVVEAPDDRLEECDEILTRCMTAYPLNCALGPVPLAVEGKTAKYWAK